MTCPKCEEGVIKKIQFKKDKKTAFLCEYCGALWPEDETIGITSGHPIQSYTKNDEIEYSFTDIGTEEDEETKSVMYPKFR